MKNIVIMGECMVELARINGDKHNKSIFQQDFAGDTYNTAVYLKRICGSEVGVHYLTTVGNDNISKQFKQNLKKENILTDCVFTDDRKTLGLYMINTDNNGERSFCYWRNDSAARKLIEHWNLSGGIEYLEQPNLFYFSGISLAILSTKDRELFWKMLNELRQQGCKIAFDPNYRSALWTDYPTAVKNITKAYQHSDIALPGMDEQTLLFGDEDIKSAFNRLNDWGISEIVLKNGEGGCHFSANGHINNIPANDIANVVDTTAAGDSFNGSYLGQRMLGTNVVESINYAVKIAGFVVQHQGAIVEKKAFRNYLSDVISI